MLRIRLFVGYMLTAALSGFTMMAYIANSSYVLQEQKGLPPLPFALFFASTALAQILLSVLNAKVVGRLPAAHPDRVRAHPGHRRRRSPDRGASSLSTPRCCSPAPGSSS